jgi:hypothetical protein
MATARLLDNRRIVLDRVPSPARWQPRRIGPRFEWLDHDRIRLQDGRLAGREFNIHTVLTDKSAAVSLLADGLEAGKAQVECGHDIVLWDVGVRPELRGCGLASVLSWIVLRETLAAREKVHVRMRMVRSLRSGPSSAEVQNVGMAVIAHRLGLQPDIDVRRITAPGMIVGSEVIYAKNGSPPGLQLLLRSDPLVLICLVLDSRTLRPWHEPRIYFELGNAPVMLEDWLLRGRLAITNGDYSLRAAGLSRFTNCLAVDADEAARLRRVIRPL